MMRKYLKSLLILFLFVTIAFSLREVRAQGTDVESISVKDAEEYASILFETVINNCVDSGNWDKNTIIDSVVKLYDKDNNISAYCIELKDSVGMDQGYIVVGANENTPPIIEFSTSGDFFVQDNEKGYYFGGINYYIQDKSNKDYFIDVVDDNIKINADNIYENNESYLEERTAYTSYSIDKCNESVVEDYIKQNELLYGSSNPPIGTIINNPFLYEDGWISLAPIDVKSYNNWYFSTSDFQGYSGHCTPTAATNLIRYWFLRNTNKYAPLIRDWQWWQIFGNMYIYMKTNDNGTYEVNCYNGLKQYLRVMGLDDSGVKWNAHIDFNDVINQLNNGHGGRPFLYFVYDHKLYENHTMLALGYMEFEYNTKQTSTKSKYSRYIRVADGWNNYPDRFVHFKIGQDASQRGMISFKPILN